MLRFFCKVLNYRTNGGKSCPTHGNSKFFREVQNVEIGGWRDEEFLPQNLKPQKF
ncbi:MAG: hypothetical protein IJ685_14280 [Selenomonadaceae bacterium]|nr:hypothetical protein [Selenomonadaceae bacterium]